MKRKLAWGVIAVCLAGQAGLAGCAGRGQTAGPGAAVAGGANVYRVSAPLVNLLACPSQTCEVLEDLGDGAQVAVTAVIPGGWLEVHSLASGRDGYLLARFVSKP
ncbi:peptide-binding protein [Desulfovibrio sp. DV]|uniref:peptide-binding protein n=1 Tax=Desulfovibrio sp. DV TaxID=1844708 RepID=UPI0020C97552|nr:peptide-binding protein [Desulfovibrio sp. DV]